MNSKAFTYDSQAKPSEHVIQMFAKLACSKSKGGPLQNAAR